MVTGPEINTGVGYVYIYIYYISAVLELLKGLLECNTGGSAIKGSGGFSGRRWDGVYERNNQLRGWAPLEGKFRRSERGKVVHLTIWSRLLLHSSGCSWTGVHSVPVSVAVHLYHSRLGLCHFLSHQTRCRCGLWVRRASLANEAPDRYLGFSRAIEMSSQAQWVRRSPSSKQGPLKATLPVSSLTRQSCGARQQRSDSPNPSPWKARASPDATGIRSPGSINYKGKCESLSTRTNDFSSNSMRRTASLDTIYVTGHWPRDSFYLSNLQVDRSTQTDEWLGESRKNLRYQDNEDKLDKFIRHRMQRTKESNNREQRCTLSFLGSGGVSNESHTQRHRMRSSIEGLNQEIERLVLRSSTSIGQDKDERKVGVENTPEGHRAPVADLLRQTRSVNTQTPAYTTTSSGHSSVSSGPPSRCSGSPVGSAVTNHSDSRPSSELQGASEDSSPEQEGRTLGTSPRINKFLAREPPDGCERVNLKFQEDNRRPMVDISEMDYPLKPSVNFQLKPSLGSAFQPLRSTQ